MGLTEYDMCEFEDCDQDVEIIFKAAGQGFCEFHAFEAMLEQLGPSNLAREIRTIALKTFR